MNRTPFRRWLAAGSTLVAVACLTVAAQPSRAAVVPVPEPTFALPAPTGRFPVGTTTLHLVDPHRRDPFVATPSNRELMVQLWYPAATVREVPLAPWMTPGAAAQFEAGNGLPAGLLERISTNAHAGAPAAKRAGRFPVVLFSPGSGNMRAEYTALLEDLASHGYVVAGVDATHDSAYVEFPDGRVETRQPSAVDQAIDVRVADLRFVLDKLAALDAGRPVDAEHRPTPAGLSGSLDLARAGVFGHSLGGDIAARLTGEDRRIRVGADLDGSVHDPVPVVTRPFLVVSHLVPPEQDPTVHEALWSNLRGWRLDLRVAGTGHLSFTDYSVLAPQVAPFVDLPESLLRSLGSIDGQRSTAVQRTYLTALFDRHLRGRGHLLDAPSPAYPEVLFVDHSPR